MQLTIRRGEKTDFTKMVEFLTKAGLSTEGLTEELQGGVILAEDREWIRGCLGMEQYGGSGLLRSLAISPGMGEQDLLAMFEQMLLLAAERNITALFLATNKRNAIPFFEMIGFKKIVKNELPSEFFNSIHVLNVLSINNSVFLKYSL
jgi:N-acetylglutamate synthase-like GNAT family acetyltransferase